jgi:hypothetical protein
MAAKDFEIYGYSHSDSHSLLNLREVTLRVSPRIARELSEFLARCAQEMEKNPDWEHQHFDGGGTTDVIVFSSINRADKSRKK